MSQGRPSAPLPDPPVARHPGAVAVVSVAEMRALEAAAMAAGTHERVLQERAGLSVADVIEEESADTIDRRARRPRAVVLVGAGNNGRDGAVAGRRLAARGWDVQIWYGSRCPLTDGEQRDMRAEGIGFARFDPAFAGDAPKFLHAAVAAADYVIDGLLGVGSRGPLRPEYEAVARVVQSSRAQASCRVVAVDVPSGTDADSGAVPGWAITADTTVTFGAVKSGLLRFPAASFAGRLVVKPIGLPAGSMLRHAVHILEEATVRSVVPARRPDDHKYRRGRVLALAGSDQYVGAAGLCAAAAARAGAGLVGVVATEAVKRVLAARLPEATYPLTLDGQVADPAAVAALLPDQQALLIGPGLGRAESTDRLLRSVLVANAALERPVPTIIDADALTLLAGWPEWWNRIGRGHVLTPHAGEMARLLSADPGLAVVEDEAPWDTARRAAARWQQVVVLKGPFTSVGHPSGRAWVWPHANPALATAGTGDVLAGLCAGLLAQRGGSSVLDMALLGVVAHAHAARMAAGPSGEPHLLASDLLPQLPRALHRLAGPSRSG